MHINFWLVSIQYIQFMNLVTFIHTLFLLKLYIYKYNLQGLISSEKRDNFNIPVYAASLEDFKEVVEGDGSFVINKLEVFRGGSPLVVSRADDAAEIGRALANSCRSVSGVLVDAHIGDQLSDELFSRVASRAMTHAKDLLENLQFFHIVASLSLA